MGKNIEQEYESDYDDEAIRELINEIEDDFIEEYETRKPRKSKKHTRNARRRIDEYWEDRILSERLSEYYDDPKYS